MYIWRMLVFVCCSECLGVCENVCCVVAVFEDSVFSLGVFKYGVCFTNNIICRIKNCYRKHTALA